VWGFHGSFILIVETTLTTVHERMEDELQQQFFVNVTPTDDQELDTTPSWDKPDTLMSPKSSTCSNHKHQEIISSNHIPATSRTPEEASESVKTLSFPLSDENRSTDLDSNKDTNHTNSHSHLYYNHCPSNKRLLGTACISFMGFASLQMVFAFVAGSQSMLGDSAAMMVDAFTYGFNYLAEQQKNRDDKSSSKSTDVLSFRDRIRLNRKRRADPTSRFCGDSYYCHGLCVAPCHTSFDTGRPSSNR
jgi:hypothetical protein